MKLKTLAAAVALTTLAAPAFAADGLFSSTTSVGTSQIQAVVGQFAQVSAIDDPIVLAPDGFGGLTHNDTICLFKSGAPGQAVTITFDSANGAGAFELTDGVNPNLPYTVALNAGGAYAPVDGTALTTAAGAATNAVNCAASGGTNADYTLGVSAAAYSAAVAGSYMDTLTITLNAL